MKQLVSTVSRSRFEKYQVQFPSDWDVQYLPLPYNQRELIDACRNAEYLFVGSVDTVSSQVFESCPHLKLVHVEGVAFDKVDVDAATKANVPVCNNRAVNSGAVAEHTIALMLSILRRIALCDVQIKTQGYESCQKAHRAEGEQELFGKHIGLIGIGAIGKEVARRLMGWGCQISYYDAIRLEVPLEEELGIHYLPLEELLSSSDIISLHVPVMPSTRNMLSLPQFKCMKTTAYLINTARGEVIDQAALAIALEEKMIAGAAIDTLYPEPAPANHPLLTLSEHAKSKVILTPHIAGTTDEAFTRMLQNAVSNFICASEGRKLSNVVNGI